MYCSNITSGSYYSQCFGFLFWGEWGVGVFFCCFCWVFCIFFFKKKRQHTVPRPRYRVKTMLIDSGFFVSFFFFSPFWLVYVCSWASPLFLFPYYLVNLQACFYITSKWNYKLFFRSSLIVNHSQLFWGVTVCVWLVTLLVLILHLLEGWNGMQGPAEKRAGKD